MGQVQDFVAARRERKYPQKPAWLTTNMTMAYALSHWRCYSIYI